MLSSTARPPLTIARAVDALEKACAHCALPLGSGAIDGRFCCEGCRQVHLALRDANLLRYYALRGSARGVPATSATPAETDAFLAREEQRLRVDPPGARRYAVEGLHCSGCVWLIERIFSDVGAGGRVDVNPARGTVDLTIPADFPLVGFGERLSRFGYRLAPRTADAPSSDLLLRLGICAALAMNAMILAIAVYAGLREGELHTLFQLLGVVLCTASIHVGGTVFFRAAIAGVRAGVASLDLPIALGIALGYVGSLVSFFVDGGDHAYFDTLTVFIALMLAGRHLRERVVVESRRQLARADDVDGMLVRRLSGSAVEIVSVAAVTPGDQLLVLPGDVLPVDAQLVDAHAEIATDWITGEADTRAIIAGAAIVSGTRNAGTAAFVARAVAAFRGSRLAEMLASPTTDVRDEEPGRRSRLEAAVARAWVPGVLVAAVCAFVGHVVAHGDVYRALTVTVALLVVTCPCAFGIATPLGHEIVLARLRREGLLVRSHGFLERAADVAMVAFDKTGTLTTGEVAVGGADIDALPLAEKRVLHDMTVRSAHPKAVAVLASLPVEARVFDPARIVVEIPGRGLEAHVDGHVYRLGERDFVVDDGTAAPGGPVFGRDGRVLATFSVGERLRADAARSVDALRARGISVHVVSGDAPDRVADVAARCGIPHALASRTPEMKAAFVEAHADERPMMIGDGINDTLATQRAFCSGTAVSGRTFLAARTDFHLLTPGLAPIVGAIDLARRLRRVVRTNVALAVFYNAIAIALSVAGVMSPLVCAVFMPASSVIAIVHTTLRLRAA